MGNAEGATEKVGKASGVTVHRRDGAILFSYGTLVTIMGGVLHWTAPTPGYAPVLAVGLGLVVGGSALFRAERARRFVNFGLLGMLLIGILAHAWLGSTYAGAVAEMSAVILLLLLVGRAGRVRLAVAVSLLLAMMVSLGMRSYSWARPGDWRAVEGAVYPIDDEFDFQGAADVDALPDGFFISKEMFLGPNGKATEVTYLRVPQPKGRSPDNQIPRAKNWVAEHVKVDGDRQIRFQWYRWTIDHEAHVRSYVLKKQPILTQSDIVSAGIVPPDRGEDWRVDLSLTTTAAERLRTARAASVGRRLAIVVEGLVRSAPLMQEPFDASTLSITLGRGATEDDAWLVAHGLAADAYVRE